ncbi:unnamed protein product [Chrysodeixis includens]|uniref:Ig-like domain-containing protein n=1 Tax=Chrysodeixis includens TaxID=689277 RepID=A0A9N8KW88_CHRIL|nr:unnamed protein product [Chrysodeixis includens]
MNIGCYSTLDRITAGGGGDSSEEITTTTVDYGLNITASTESVIQPYFDNATKRDYTAAVGQPAYLHCRVKNLGDRAWAKTTTEWSLVHNKRQRGRPRRRWRDDLDSFLPNWSLVALERDKWKKSREAFAQQWDISG